MKLSDETPQEMINRIRRTMKQRPRRDDLVRDVREIASEQDPTDTEILRRAADELDRLTAKEAEWQAVFGLSEKWAHEKDSADVERRLRRLAESIRNGTANASENFDLIDTVIRRLDTHRHERARHDALTNHWRKHDLPRPTYWQTEDGLRIIELQDEINRLAAALPKTEDGVTIVPGMEGLFTVYEGNVYGPYSACSVAHDREVEMSTAHDHIPDWHSPSVIYSTRTAAEEATK